MGKLRRGKIKNKKRGWYGEGEVFKKGREEKKI